MARGDAQIWLQVDGYNKVYAIADEDLERATTDKTSAVHFMRFELDADMISSLREGAAALAMGSDHDGYQHSLTITNDATRSSLLNDFD